MGKKKKKGKSVAKKQDPLDLLSAMGGRQSKAGDRINRVIQRISNPETLLDHLKRIGADFWVVPKGVDRQGDIIDRPCLVVPWDDLIRKELEHLQSGGEFGDVYGPNRQMPLQISARRHGKSLTGGAENFAQLADVAKKMAPALKGFGEAMKKAQEDGQKKVVRETDDSPLNSE